MLARNREEFISLFKELEYPNPLHGITLLKLPAKGIRKIKKQSKKGIT